MADWNISIHPRVSLRGEKLNTAKPRSRARIERAIAGMDRHIAAHPRDAACRERRANAEARAKSL